MLWNQTNQIEGEQCFFIASETQRWNDALSLVGSGDVYLSREYHILSHFDTGAQPLAYFNQIGEHKLFFPFLFGEIPDSIGVNGHEHLYDLESCYGYGGPLSTTTETRLLTELWKPFLKWCQTNGVVAGFIRCHPILRTQQYLPGLNTVTQYNRDTVLVDLRLSEEEVWVSYPPSQRTNIRKAQKHGLRFRLGDTKEIETIFRPMYEKTMESLHATSRYFFNSNYFEFIASELAQVTDLLVVESANQPVASALFFKGDGVYHYHLGASLHEFRDLRPNNLLFYEASKLGKAYGFQNMHLGGGKTTDPADSLFRFKSSFGKGKLPFYIAHTIFLPEQYQALCDAWLLKSTLSVKPLEFLLYRKKLPNTNS